MRTPHTSCRKGKKVKLILRNGEIVISKFIENKGNTVFLESGKYPNSTIRAFTIYKNKKP